MFNINHLSQASSLLVIAAVIFAESGMMVGFFFPGDTLLFSAGILAASGKLSLGLTIFVIALAAILGDNVGYHIGSSFGYHLFNRPDGLIFRREYIKKAEIFYKKYGSQTMLLAHFVPVVRTFVPVTAGAGQMPLFRFMLFDAIGDTAWAILITCLGYFVGSRIPGIKGYIDPVLIIIVLAFVAPTLYHILKDQKIRQAISRQLKKFLRQ
ncbi:MAG: DedA family protein [Candidatus Saccharimonadales bacterium]